ATRAAAPQGSALADSARDHHQAAEPTHRSGGAAREISAVAHPSGFGAAASRHVGIAAHHRSRGAGTRPRSLRLDLRFGPGVAFQRSAPLRLAVVAEAGRNASAVAEPRPRTAG